MDALDAIERRIDQLNRIVGNAATATAATTAGAYNTGTGLSTDDNATAAAAAANKPHHPQQQQQQQPFCLESLTDSLASATTLVASAMAGREKISDVVQRSAELEHMLDPAYLDEQQATKAKEVYVNTVAPDLAATFEQLEQVKKLEPALGAEYFRSIPDVAGQVESMTEQTAELAQRNDLLEESLTIALQRYDEVQSGINRSLVELNERIDQLEEKLRSKRTRQRDAKEEANAEAAEADGK